MPTPLPIPSGYNTPPTVSVTDNVQQAQQYAATHSTRESYSWFYNQVRNNGPWDYKQQGSQYQTFGNWHYGAMGTAMGIPEWVLLRMAGAAQILAGTSKPQFGNPLGSAPYGDDPADQVAIRDGVSWSIGSGYERSMLFPPEPLGLPGTWEVEGWGITAEGVNGNWNSSLFHPGFRDPLALDLDADGIETVGIPTNRTPVLFDHNANGVRTGTGWVAPDDAWLVLDRNGNGSIDSGRELFGVDTLITISEQLTGPNGPYTHTYTRNAQNGFEALRDLDRGNGTAGSTGYGDNVFDANDAQFANVRLWQDLNQDGESQAAELFTLAERGITSIGLVPGGGTVNLGNGNSITGQTVVTHIDDSTTLAGSVDVAAGNLNLADNPFYRAFGDAIPIIAAAVALPEMGGSGWLRNLREAMSLGTTSANALLAKVQQFNAATTRDAQVSLLDEVIGAWADSTGRPDLRALPSGLRIDQVFQLGAGPAHPVTLVAAAPVKPQ